MEHAAIHGLVVPNMLNCWPAKENEIATCCYGKGFASSCNCILTKDGRKARLHSHFNGLARMQGPPRTKQENKIATRNPFFATASCTTVTHWSALIVLSWELRPRTFQAYPWPWFLTSLTSRDYFFLRGLAFSYSNILQMSACKCARVAKLYIAATCPDL